MFDLMRDAGDGCTEKSLKHSVYIRCTTNGVLNVHSYYIYSFIYIYLFTCTPITISK